MRKSARLESQRSGRQYLKQHDVVEEVIWIIIRMGDSSEHRDVLLGPFLSLDVVSSQGDIYGTAKEKLD